MRVALFPADVTGCGRYRMILPAEAARKDGLQAGLAALRREPDGRVVGMPDVDVAVFQRPAHPLICEAIPAYQRKGIGIVVDLDDDLAALDARHPAFSELHPRNRTNWRNIAHACELADLVTVSTPALAARYGRGNARVLPNCVPEALLGVRAERDGQTVGWAGVTATHVDDLRVTRGGVARALQDTGARFLLIGRDAADAKRQLGLAHEPETTGYVPFDDYPRVIARLDIGIAPLRATRFNQAKSALKGLEYAALGIPFVASPLPEYERIHQEGIGTLAERGRDWRREIRRLLQDPAAASESRARAREAVAAGHTIERNAWRWVEAWTDALMSRRGEAAA